MARRPDQALTTPCTRHRMPRQISADSAPFAPDSSIARIGVSLAAHKPKHDKNDQDDTKNPAESGEAIVAVRVIATAAAQENDQQYDDEYRAHGRALRLIALTEAEAADFTAFSPRRALGRFKRH